MPSILDRVRENMDPQSAANALYEIMLLWLAVDNVVRSSPPRQRPIQEGQRDAYERSLSLFLGVKPREVRFLLRQHFKRSGAEHGRNSSATEGIGNVG